MDIPGWRQGASFTVFGQPQACVDAFPDVVELDARNRLASEQAAAIIRRHREQQFEVLAVAEGVL